MLKSFFLTSIVSYLVLGFTMLTSIVVARHYGPSGQGVLAALILIPQMMISYGDLGVSESIMYHLSNSYGKIVSFNKSIFLIFFETLFIMLFGFTLYYLFFSYSEIEDSYALGVIYLVLFYLNQVLTFISRGILDLKRYNVSLIISNLSLLLFILICSALDLPIRMVFVAYILSSVFSVLYLLFSIKIPSVLGKKLIEYRVKDIYKYGFKTYAYKVLNSTESQFDKFIIASVLPKVQLGYYSVAVVLSSLLYLFVVRPISSIILPILNGVHELKEKQTLITLINKLIFWIGVLFSLVMLIFSKIFVELVYGVSYLPALVPLWILLIGVVLKAPMSILAYYFKSIGLPEVMVKISIITVVLNVISGLLFIPRYGIIAAAIISTISYTIYSILLSRKYMKMTNKGLSEQYLFSQSEITLIKDYIISFNINSK